MRSPADDFFARLPDGKLSHDEARLRSLLLDTAAAAARLLPGTGVVSLQQWVERRMPGELVFPRDSFGSFHIQATGGVRAQGLRQPAHPPMDVRGPQGELRPDDPSQHRVRPWQGFLDSLPKDRLTEQEIELRDAIVAALEVEKNYKLTVLHLKKDNKVLQACLSFLPKGVFLETWIEYRIGAEISLSKTNTGGTMCSLPAEHRPAKPSTEERIANVEAFFEDLPEDSLLEAEMDLRDAIVKAIDVKKGPTTLSVIGGDKAVCDARRAFLVKGVSLKDWLVRRLADTVALHDLAHGQVECRLLDPQGDEDFPDDGLENDDEVGDADLGDEDHRREEKAAKADSFFKTLPQDSLTTEELDLRDALHDFLDSWKKDTVPSLSHAGCDEKVNQCRTKLLPSGVALQLWVDSRIGGELELVRCPGDRGTGEVLMCRRGEVNEAALNRTFDKLRANQRRGGERSRRGRDRGARARAFREKGKGKGKGGGKGRPQGGEPNAKRRRR